MKATTASTTSSSRVQATVRKLQALFADYPSVVYAVEHFEGYAWGIRAQFYDDVVGIVSMMVYGPANTQADLERVVRLLD